jgi:hypothetical protein
VVGVTCFHVINPTENGKGDNVKAIIRTWRQQGINPDGDNMAKHLTVFHPSSRAIKENTQFLKKEIEKLQTPQYKLCQDLLGCGQKLRKGDEIVYLQAKKQISDSEALLSDIQDFDPRFGRVWAASGFRIAQAPSINSGANRLPTNYDWALIEVPRERVGRNTVSLAAERFVLC